MNQVRIVSTRDPMVSLGDAHDPPHEANESHGRHGGVDTLGALKRYRYLIVGAVVLCVLLAFGITKLITPKYSAEAGVMIDPRRPAQDGGTAPSTLPPSEETVRKNEIAIIRSRALAENVVDKLNLELYPEFNRELRPDTRFSGFVKQAQAQLATWMALATGKPVEDYDDEPKTPEQIRAAVVDAFMARLSTTSTDASRVIGVRFQSEDPVRAAVVANLVAEEYIEQKRMEELSAARETGQMLEQEIETLNGEIREFEREIDRLRQGRGVSLDGNVRVLTDRLAELNRQLAAATGERMRAESRISELQAARGGGNANAVGSVLDSLLIQRLQGEAALLTAKIGQMSSNYGDAHPKIVEARAELRDLRVRIDAEIAKISAAQNNAVTAAKANEAALRQELDKVKEQVAKVSASEIDMRALEREAEGKRTLLGQLIAQFNEVKARINVLQQHGPETRVLSQAVVPLKASFPPTLPMLATAMLLAGVGASILAVFLDRRDRSIRSMAQIRGLTDVPVLGTVPMVKGWLGLRRPHQQVLVKGNSMLSEHLRSIWFQVRSHSSHPPKVMLVTSALASEGKSTIASSMGRMLAKSGQRTVIVDADLRRPNVHRVLELGRGPGLADVIKGDCELSDALQCDETSGVYVLSAGTATSSPSDILQSERLQDILVELSAAFDVVIIDSPPILAVHDAGILARHAQRTIMVVRWHSTTVSTLHTALRRMSDMRTPIDGIVLSMIDSRKYRSYGYPDSEVFSRGFRKYYTS